MPIAYFLSGPDNDSYMFGPDDELGTFPELRLCSSCGYRLDFDAHNPAFTLIRRAFDFSYTTDNACIVSRRFMDFCLHRAYGGLRFNRFDPEPDFFHLLVDPILPFDAKRRGTKQGKPCPTCGNPPYVAGVTPVYLKGIHAPIEDGFFRTDLRFGDGNEKTPLLLVGLQTRAELEEGQFRGLDMHTVEP